MGTLTSIFISPVIIVLNTMGANEENTRIFCYQNLICKYMVVITLFWLIYIGFSLHWIIGLILVKHTWDHRNVDKNSHLSLVETIIMCLYILCIRKKYMSHMSDLKFNA